jgi:hypothetical protein
MKVRDLIIEFNSRYPHFRWHKRHKEWLDTRWWKDSDGSFRQASGDLRIISGEVRESFDTMLQAFYKDPGCRSLHHSADYFLPKLQRWCIMVGGSKPDTTWHDLERLLAVDAWRLEYRDTRQMGTSVHVKMPGWQGIIREVWIYKNTDYKQHYWRATLHGFGGTVPAETKHRDGFCKRDALRQLLQANPWMLDAEQVRARAFPSSYVA